MLNTETKREQVYERLNAEARYYCFLTIEAPDFNNKALLVAKTARKFKQLSKLHSAMLNKYLTAN